MATAPRSDTLKELTFRGIILGAILTVLFTAANVYLGLKLGITFATSIPAAVISMAVLKFFHDATIQENNIVQTIASAAGTLVGDHLRPARPDHGRLVDRLPLLAVGRDHRHRRHPGRDVFGAAAPRARNRIGPALSGRRGRSRSAQGRGRGRRGRGEPARPQRDPDQQSGVGRLLRPRQDEAGGRKRQHRFSSRCRRDRRLRQSVDGADRRRPSGRHGRRHRHDRRRADQLGVDRPDLDHRSGADRGSRRRP